jgi:hypothetical protein
MTLKTLAIAGLSAAAIALGAGAADAKTKFRIGVGIGDNCDFYGDCYYGGGYGVGYGYYGDPDDRPYRKRRHFDYDDDYDHGRLSCGEARRILRGQGWRRVRAEDCSGRRYSFTGWRHGEPFSIRISAWSGRIVSVRPLY